MISRTRGLNRLAKYAFSSIASPQMTDWEYTNKIQQSLQQNDINQALKYLINSHLDGQVLDMHVFRNYYLKADKLKAGISYSEIAYQLYRHNFKPHSLVLDWMNSLARSNNPNIIKQLEVDFKSLQMEMPNPKKVEQEEPIKLVHESEKTPTTKLNEPVPVGTQKTQNLAKKEVEAPKSSSPSPQNEGLEKSLKDKYTFEEIEKIPAFMEMRGSLKNLISSLCGMKPSITFHNVRVELGADMEEGEYFENDEPLTNEGRSQGEEEEYDEVDEYGDEQYIKQIKIERIEVSFNNAGINKIFDKHNKEN